MRRVWPPDASFPPWIFRANRDRFFFNKVHLEGDLGGCSNSFGDGQPFGRDRLRGSGDGKITNQPVPEFFQLCQRLIPFLLYPGQPGLFLGDLLAE